jgi:hypothetical protein
MLLFGFEKLDYFIFPVHEGTIFFVFLEGSIWKKVGFETGLIKTGKLGIVEDRIVVKYKLRNMCRIYVSLIMAAVRQFICVTEW